MYSNYSIYSWESWLNDWGMRMSNRNWDYKIRFSTKTGFLTLGFLTCYTSHGSHRSQLIILVFVFISLLSLHIDMTAIKCLKHLQSSWTHWILTFLNISFHSLVQRHRWFLQIRYLNRDDRIYVRAWCWN